MLSNATLIARNLLSSNVSRGTISTKHFVLLNSLHSSVCQNRWIVTQGLPASKLLVVHPNQKSEALLQEALRLAESYTGTTCSHVGVGPSKQLNITSSTYFGPGVVKAIQEVCTAQEPTKVFVNVALSPVQQRNLQTAVGIPVLDRVGLIIEIFAQRAQTREARLQVELAALDYRSSRLVRALDSRTGERMGFGEGGTTEVVSARERGRSGSSSGGLGGASGGGQSELQLQRQRLIARRKALQKKLSEVQRTREVQRAARRRAGKPVLAVVGYTNAGKSSLMQALTRTPAGVQDRLFATLDPAHRRVHLPSGREAILSDTVGFISDLPHQLVNAFRATLEEVCEADLLLHVLDASSPHVTQQREAVLQVLRELGISEARLQNGLVEVWNKTDLIPARFADPPLPIAHQQGTASANAQATAAVQHPAAMSHSSDSHASAEQQPPALLSNSGSEVSAVPQLVAASSSAGSVVSQAAFIRQQLHKQLGTDRYRVAAQQHQDPIIQSLASAGRQSSASESAQEQPARGPRASELLHQTQPSSALLPEAPQHLPAASANSLAQASQGFQPQTSQGVQPWGSQGVQPQASQGVQPQANQSPMHSPPGDHQHGRDLGSPEHQTNAGPAGSAATSVDSGKPLAMFTSAVTGEGLPELLSELERKISLKWATRDLADGTARLGPRLLTHTVVGPPNKQRRPRWQGSGEWESALTQSIKDQSTVAVKQQTVKAQDINSLARRFLSSCQQ